VSPVFCGGAHLCFVYLKDSGSVPAHLCFINLKDGGGAPLILYGLCEIPLVSNQLPAVLPPSEHWRWLTLGIVCVEYVKTDSSRLPKM
jgi:hypothetical protein